MFTSCKKNVEYYTQKLGNSFDIVNKFFSINNQKIAIFYLKTLVDDKLLVDVILSPLTQKHSQKITLDYIRNLVVNTADIIDIQGENDQENDKKLMESVLNGGVAIFLENETTAICVDIKDFPKRSPTEPPTSAVIYGPRIGFVESIETNVALIRRRLATPSLIIKNFIIGKYTQSRVFLTYLDGVANKKMVKEVIKQLEKINIDGIVDSNYILSYFQGDSKFFKRTGVAEKPDIVTAKILEGRVAILVDGSPIVLTLPFMVFEDLQNSNDYYTNNIYSSFIRFIRLLGIFVAVILPGVYLALRLYHYKVLPLRFLITISNTTEGLPFTPFVELLFILVLFQILYEVSLRLPQYLGLATSIVGALILGQTGVNAGLISPPGVVIIAMSFISVYTVSDEIAQLTLLRVIFLILGGTIGLLGIVGALIYFIDELATLNQYGTSYLAPYAPRKPQDLKDGFFIKPIVQMKTRPKSLKTPNKVRQKNDK